MSGLNLLYKLLLKDVVKGSGQASGIMSIGGDIRKLADKKFQSYVMTAKAKGVDLDKLSEQEIKYMLQLNKPKPIKAISADSPEGKLFTQGMIDMLDKASGKNVIKTDFGGGITDIVTETITKIKSKKPIEAMAEANSVLARKGKYKNLTEEQSQKIIKDTEDHIFERNVDVDPEDFAHGGRTGSGLNYLLGEDDQNSRMPYAGGGASLAYAPQLPANGYLGGSGQPNPQGGGGEQKTLEDFRSQIGNGFYDLQQERINNPDYFKQLPSSPGADNQLNVTPPKIPPAMQQPMSGVQTPDPFFGNEPPNTKLSGMWGNQQFDSAKSAWDDVVKQTQEYRKNSPHSRDVVGSEAFFQKGKDPFENFSNAFKDYNDPNKPRPQPQQLQAAGDPIGPTTLNGRPANIDNQGQPGPNDGVWHQGPGPWSAVPEVPGAIQQPMPGDTSFGVMKALPNLNNEFFPTPSYDPPEVSEEQKIIDPYQRAGGYKKQPATTPEEEVRSRENSVAQAVGAKPGALSQALGLAYGGIAGMLGEPTYADGGRIGLKDGTKFDPKRRTILKGIATLAALPVIGKYFKWAKPLAKSSKVLTSVPINNIDGMPVWFKPLVNRVIKEGDDVTKKFGTVDREIVHKTKLPDSQTDVIVTQDLTTGDVVVDIGMGKHGFKEGHLGQPVRLEYKAAEDIMAGPDMDAMFKVGERDPHIKVKSRDEMTFDQKKYPDKKPEEFWVEEAEFTGGHPENVKFEETISEKFGQHGSNFDEVEKFATGTVKKTKKTESRVFGKKYLSEGDDMASGGRVPLGGGGIAGMLGE